MSYFRVQESFLRLRPSKSIFYRLQSTNSKGKRSGVKVAVYGLTLTSASVIGATVTYANYDPQFKMTIDSYVPGFGSLSERSAVLWHKGVILVGDGWKNVKKVMLPEKSDRVGIQAPYTSKKSKDVQTTPIVPVEAISTSTESTVGNTIPETSTETTPTETTPTETTPTETTPTETESTETTNVTSDIPSEEITIASETKPTETIPVEADTKSTEDLSTKTTPTVAESTETKSTEVSAADTKPTEVLSMPSTETTPTKEVSTETTSTEEVSTETTSTTDTFATSGDALPDQVTSHTDSFSHLQDTFKEFTSASDEVIESLNDLLNALNTHHLQVSEAAKSPPKDEKDMDLLVGSIIGTEEAVDAARTKVERAKEKHHSISIALADAISAAKKEGANGIVDQICDKIGSYTEAFEEGEKKVKEAGRFSQSQELEGTDVALTDNQDTSVLLTKIASLEKEIETMKYEKNKMAEDVMNQAQQQDEVIKEKILHAIQEKEEEFKEKLENLEVELEFEYEQKIKEQLYSQAKAHIAHARNALDEQAKKLSDELEQKHNEREKELTDDYQLKLAKALAHLKGIHSVIDTVVETSDSTRRQQSVRVASDALTNVIITANSDPDPYTRHSIDQEVKALLKVAQSDSFISTILSGIPQEALSHGISSEAGLKTRFTQVKRIASRVALVPEEGGGLGTYLLSFLQSLLTIDMIHTRMIELSNTDPQSLSTFDLLRQANLSLDHGDLERAVKFVAQLKGESRRVTQDWLHEALMYLETRQAVMAITQYLAASNAAVL